MDKVEDHHSQEDQVPHRWVKLSSYNRLMKAHQRIKRKLSFKKSRIMPMRQRVVMKLIFSNKKQT